MALTRPKFSQFDTTVSTISDPLTILNNSATTANVDVGFIVNRNGGGVSNVAFVWQESSSQFILAATSSTGATNANIAVSNYSNLRIGNVSATTVTSTNLIGAPNVIVTGSMLPSANITYDLGSPTQRWRSGWFSGTTIYIGNESISADTSGNWTLTSGSSSVTLGVNANFVAASATIAGNVISGNVSATNYNYANGVSILATVGTIISTANTALKGYTDGQITTVNSSIVTANTALKGYTDGQITTVNSSIVTANTALKGYVDGQITTVNSSIVTANTALKGYADAITTAWTGNATTQLSQITAANAAIVTANTAMQGYVDGRFTTLIGGAPTILDTLNEIAIALGNDSNLSVTLTNTITTANTNMKGYVDGQITTVNSSISTANTALKGYADGQITTVNSSIVTANTALKGYVDSQDSAITTAWTSNATTQLSQINTLTSSVTGANAAIVTANTAMQGYADAITTAWTSNATTQLSQITAANAAIVTANTALKGYTDGQLSSKANIDSQTFTGNVIFNSIGAIRLPSGTTAQRTTGTAGDFRYNSTTGGFEGYTTTWGSLAGGGGGTPGGADTQIQFNNSGSAFAGALSLHYFTGNGVVLANAGVASTSTTTGTLQVTGGIGATGNITAGNIIAGGVRQTIAGTVPSNPTVGDQWYDTSTDILFNFTYDGTNYVWVDISSMALNTALAGSISGTSLSISGIGSFTGAVTVPSIINGGTTGVGNIGSSTVTFNTAFLKATTAQYADLAENYQADASYVPGTVIIFGGVNEVTISNISHDTAVAGVVSTNPAYLMNSKINAEYISAVALQGRVPCLVRGPINKGDLVVTSDIPGIAQRMDKKLYEPGCIIGKSLDAITANEIKTIEVVIGRF